jgi:hypothetical protein
VSGYIAGRASILHLESPRRRAAKEVDIVELIDDVEEGVATEDMSIFILAIAIG